MSEKTSYKILVAEDDTFQRHALLDLLTMCGYEAITVENGKQAMEQLKNELNEFDLVLLDLYMPEMDGFEVLTHMQEDERLQLIPIVVMSSTESNDIISNCLKMGALNYLVKPIRI
jgi:PleD family two-component response regulator